MDNSLPHDKTLFPQSITDRYAISEQIGQGGMGNVYLATDTQLLRQVAIKAIRSEHLNKEDVLKRIDRECKMHAAIGSHPHIVSLFDRIDKGGNIFLIMEYVEGQTLAELIKRNDPIITAEFIIQITIQALNALGAIHAQGVIHRDIKPANIIIGGIDKNLPNAKIMDFGIARDLEEDETLTKLTMLDSGGPGTPAYMAPERIDSATFGDIVPATDLYAIGIILFELYHKQTPFHGTITEIFSGHLAKQPDIDSLHSIQPEIKDILTKALTKHPEKRYRTAQEFSNHLKEASLSCNDKTLLNTSFNISDISQTDSNQAESLPVSLKRSKRLLTIAILFLLSGALTIFFLILPPKKNLQEPTIKTPLQKATTNESLLTTQKIQPSFKQTTASAAIPVSSPSMKPSLPEPTKQKIATDAYEQRRQEKLLEITEAKRKEEERRAKEEAEKLELYRIGLQRYSSGSGSTYTTPRPKKRIRHEDSR